MRTAVTSFAAIALMFVVLCGCGRAIQYSDDAINAAKGLIRTNSDDAAVRFLDDAAAAADNAAGVQQATIAWSATVTSIEERLVRAWGTTPDDAARVRSLVVGSACDVFEEAQNSLSGEISQAQVNEIVTDNRISSGFPEGLDTALLVFELADEISTAMESGDFYGAAPGIAQIVACQAASG
jgi:hypothetical protein